MEDHRKKNDPCLSQYLKYNITAEASSSSHGGNSSWHSSSSSHDGSTDSVSSFGGNMDCEFNPCVENMENNPHSSNGNNDLDHHHLPQEESERRRSSSATDNGFQYPMVDISITEGGGGGTLAAAAVRRISGKPGRKVGSKTNNEREQICKVCRHVSGTKDEHWKHIRIHMDPSKIMNCPEPSCSFVSTYKHHLTFHAQNHKGVKSCTCDKCGYKCVNLSMLKSHMKSHSDIFQYHCGSCGYKTKYYHSLKQHLRKYDHKPGDILDKNGLPNPEIIIDVNGTRRGPKQKGKQKQKPNRRSDKSKTCGDVYTSSQNQQVMTTPKQPPFSPTNIPPSFSSTNIPPPSFSSIINSMAMTNTQHQLSPSNLINSMFPAVPILSSPSRVWLNVPSSMASTSSASANHINEIPIEINNFYRSRNNDSITNDKNNNDVDEYPVTSLRFVNTNPITTISSLACPKTKNITLPTTKLSPLSIETNQPIINSSVIQNQSPLLYHPLRDIKPDTDNIPSIDEVISTPLQNLNVLNDQPMDLSNNKRLHSITDDSIKMERQSQIETTSTLSKSVSDTSMVTPNMISPVNHVTVEPTGGLDAAMYPSPNTEYQQLKKSNRRKSTSVRKVTRRADLEETPPSSYCEDSPLAPFVARQDFPHPPPLYNEPITPNNEESTSSRNNPFKCLKCGIDFNCEILYHFHNLFHDKSSKFTCRLCSTKMENSIQFNMHMVLSPHNDVLTVPNV